LGDGWLHKFMGGGVVVGVAVVSRIAWRVAYMFWRNGVRVEMGGHEEGLH
jgi:hypothetical protein